MPEQLTNEHIQRRVVHSDRDGNEHLGTIIDVMSSPPLADVKIDSGPMSSLERNWLPHDTLTLVPLAPPVALDITG